MEDNGVPITGSGLSSLGLSIAQDLDKLDDPLFVYYNFVGVAHNFVGW